jgi:type II secretion system protein H
VTPISPLPTRPRDRGFTLVEVVIVIAIAAMVFQLVVGNMGAMIPARAMDSAAAEIVSKVDWLRSEARLQGKTYKLELDITGSRYRFVVPPTDLQAAAEEVEETFGMSWFSLGDHVRLTGCGLAGGQQFTSGSFLVVFDANGFTADQAIFLEHVEDKQMVWTIQIRGLTGQSEVMRSYDGTQHPLEKLEEGQF